MRSKHRLITTLAASAQKRLEYALEGSIFIGGAVVQWLRDNLRLIGSSAEVEALAASVPDTGGVVFVPAFVGLGAPHWDPHAGGMLIGLRRDTKPGHIARAALESIAFQVADVLEAMHSETDTPLGALRVDGGAAVNDLLMQFQADVLGVPVVRPRVTETTALGAAYLAGLASASGRARDCAPSARATCASSRAWSGRSAPERRALLAACRRALANELESSNEQEIARCSGKRCCARSAMRAQETPWDIAVIGGGATGVGVAVDAAARGLDVVLVEAHDFGKGTSSRSTKLVHGGVRYLEQGNIPLVMSALKERGLLRQNAPHLVHDLAFVVPNYSWWEAPFYGIGLKLYDLLAGKYGFGASKLLSKEETLERLPALEPEGLRGGVVYYDGQFDDARLLIHLAMTAADHGAHACELLPRDRTCCATRKAM